MELTISQEKARVPVAVMAVGGQLDGQTYQEAISKAQELYAAGTRDILLDLSNLTYISSAGLVALHTMALILRGEALPDAEHGWASIKSMDRGRASGKQQHIKLTGVRPEVMSVLEMVGFSMMFDIFDDRAKALESF
jgi:anti-anti-sigma regulatory factor